jgi:hypothetical protein
MAVVAAAVVWVPTTASAKGARDAILRGPGVEANGTVKLDPDQAMALSIATNVYSALENEGPNRAALILAGKPKGDLGPRYVVTFNLFADGDGTKSVRQRLYPFAEGGPVSYLPAGQAWCEPCGRTKAGWFAMKSGVFDVLRDVGVRTPAS